MLITAAAFLAGTSALELLGNLPDVSLIAALLLAMTLLAACLPHSAATVVIALGLGFGWAWGAASHRVAIDLPAGLEGRDIDLTGYVASLPERRGRDLRFEFVPTPGQTFLPARVLLTWYDSPVTPAAGELRLLRVRLKRRRGFANPGGFDHEAALLRDGVGASGYVKMDLAGGPVGEPDSRYLLLRLRAGLGMRLAAALYDDRFAGVLTALITGDRSAIAPEQWAVFSSTGTSHLMAISGLHIGMVAALGAWLGSGLIRLPAAQRRRWSATSAGAASAAVTAAGYAALAGFTIPTQRALIMLGVLVLASGLRREIATAQGLAAALFAVLLIEPLAPLSAGFWLSFAAVGAIGWTWAGLLRRPAPGSSLVRVQLAVSVGLLPVVVALFGQVSLVAPVVNLVAVPLFGLLVVPVALLGTLLLLLWPPLGEIVLGADHRLLELTWPALELAAQAPLALWQIPSLASWAGALLVAGAVLLVGPGIAASRVLGLALCLPGLAGAPTVPERGALQVTVLDVGQGLAVVVRTHAHVLLYDAGPGFRSGSDAASLAIVPYLRHQGIRSIDRLILSHGDLDHVGGAPTLLREIELRDIAGSPSVRLAGWRLRHCRRGERWIWDDVSFAIVHPPARSTLADNDGSCVLLIRGTGGSVLLSGDIEQTGEQETMGGGVSGPVDLVVAPHHGSLTSSSPQFVQAMRARYVIFATGQGNRWGFPRPEVVERWRGAGAVPFITADSGAVTVRAGRQGIEEPREYRRERRRYWHTR